MHVFLTFSMLTTFELKVVQRSVARLKMHPDVDWHQEGNEEGLKECRFGKNSSVEITR